MARLASSSPSFLEMITIGELPVVPPKQKKNSYSKERAENQRTQNKGALKAATK
jgi:hypothetical protein